MACGMRDGVSKTLKVGTAFLPKSETTRRMRGGVVKALKMRTILFTQVQAGLEDERWRVENI
jgi:hypothetical protein